MTPRKPSRGKEPARVKGKPGQTDAYRVLFERAAYPALIARQADAVILAVNEAWERALGVSREEAVGRTAIELGVVADPGAREERLATVAASGSVRDALLKARTRSGDVRIFSANIDRVQVDGEWCFVGTWHDLTDRIEAESAVRESERRLRAAIEAGRVGLWEWDLETDHYWVSSEIGRQLGYHEGGEESLAANWRALIHPEDLPGVITRRRAAIADDRHALDHEYRVRHRDGTWRWILSRASIARDASGRALKMLGSHVDITPQKTAEHAIAQLHRVRGVLSAVNQLIIREWEPDAMLARACEIAVAQGSASLAWAATVVTPESPLEVSAIAGGDAQAQEDVRRIIAANGCSFTSEAMMTGQPSVCRDIGNDERARPWRAEAARAGLRSMAALPLTVGADRIGTINLYSGEVGFFDETEVAVLTELASDLSFGLEVARRRRERHAGEARIARQQATLVALTSQEKVNLWDHETALARIVEAAAEALEVERVSIWRYEDARQRIRCVDLYEAAAKRHSAGAVLDASGAPSYFRALESSDVIDAADARVDPRTAEFTDGYLRPLDIRSMLDAPIHIHGERAGVLCMESVGVSRAWRPDELTFAVALANLVSLALESAEHRRGQLALRESESRFRELAESIREVFWVTDPAKRTMLYVSPAYEAVWGRPASALLADPLTWLDAVHPDDRARVREALANQAQGTYDEVYRIVRPDGQERWINDRAFPVQAPDGRVERVVGVARDITDVRHLEEQLRQSQKMEAVGLLAGGIAHDFNNILAVVLMQAELAATTENVPDETREGLRQIRGAAERAANLTRQLLLFGRRQLMRPRAIDLNEIVSHLGAMLRRIIGEDVSLQLDLHREPLVIHADPGMIDQVLLNLSVNARDVMPSGGELRISTGVHDSAEGDRERPVDVQPGGYARLSVADRGTGIAPEILTRIFEPFFTTKPAGKGTGLGLATVFGIVRQHHGWIRADNRTGGGAIFDVFLPLATGHLAEADDAESRSAGEAGTETILLAEDEPLVRALAERVLEKAGYRVLAAGSGAEALAVAREAGREIALLVSDLVMPGGMNGQELAQRLVAERPGLRVLFTSGYSADLAGQELTLRPGEQFLGKPFTPNQLLSAVRQTIDAIV